MGLAMVALLRRRPADPIGQDAARAARLWAARWAQTVQIVTPGPCASGRFADSAVPQNEHAAVDGGRVRRNRRGRGGLGGRWQAGFFLRAALSTPRATRLRWARGPRSRARAWGG